MNRARTLAKKSRPRINSTMVLPVLNDQQFTENTTGVKVDVRVKRQKVSRSFVIFIRDLIFLWSTHFRPGSRKHVQ